MEGSPAASSSLSKASPPAYPPERSPWASDDDESDTMSPATNSIDDDELDAEALLLPPSVIEGLPLPTPEPGPQWDVQERHRGIGSKGFMIRALALLCACSLSIGSH